jgi:hypothetical protein
MKVFLNKAGLISFCGKKYNLHLLIKFNCWQLGYKDEGYDGIKSFGFGPLFLFVWG